MPLTPRVMVRIRSPSVGSEPVGVGVLVQARQHAPDGGQPDLVASHQGAQLVVAGAPQRLDECLGIGVGEEGRGLLGGRTVQDVEGYLCHSVTITAPGRHRA